MFTEELLMIWYMLKRFQCTYNTSNIDTSVVPNIVISMIMI